MALSGDVNFALQSTAEVIAVAVKDEVYRLIKSGALADPDHPPVRPLFRVALENVAMQMGCTTDDPDYKNLKHF